MVPFIIIYLFNWAIYVSIFWSLLRKTPSKIERSATAKLKQHFIIALTLSLLFGLGWGVGLAATSSIPVAELSYTLQTVFVLLTSFQGLWIFMMNCVRPEEARRVWQSWVHVITCHKVSLGAKKSTSGHTPGSYSNGTLGKYVKRYLNSSTTLTFHSPTRHRIMKRETDSTPEATRDESLEDMDSESEDAKNVFDIQWVGPDEESRMLGCETSSLHSVRIVENPSLEDMDSESEDAKNVFYIQWVGPDEESRMLGCETSSLHSVRIVENPSLEDMDSESKDAKNVFDIQWVEPDEESRMLGCETSSFHSARIVENPSLEDMDSESEDAKNVFDIQWVGPDEESHPLLLVERPTQMDQVYAAPVPTDAHTETYPVPTDDGITY